MAVTQINLSDAVTTLVTKTNTISSDLGDKALLSTADKTNLVAAINEINTQVGKVDSADVINLITANALDSSEVIQLLADTTADANIYSNFQKLYLLLPLLLVPLVPSERILLPIFHPFP